MTQKQIEFEQRVDDRIAALLARVEGVRRGSDIGRPVVFDERGAAHANQIAQRDRQQGGK